MPRRPTSNPRARAATALRRSTGALSTTAMARMETDMPWFRELSAEDRSWVGLIVQAGIKGFVDWYGADAEVPEADGNALAASIFGAAPRALAGVITLQQTVDLVRLSIEVVESNIDGLLDPDDLPAVHAAVLRYAREVAFATAEVYARAAEARGAWDARLEALVVDSVLRAEPDESVLSRASAVGWGARGQVAVVLAAMPERRTETDLFDAVRRVARAAGLDALCAVQGDRLVVLLGGVADAKAAAEPIVELVGAGPVVVGPVTEDLSHAHLSARAALSAYRAASGWPEAPRPVRSSDLLPERALAGDGHARRHLVEEVYLPLLEARGTLIETLAAYFETGSSLEATSRALFVHANTVRYRLRQVGDVTGYTPAHHRDALTLQIALVLGRQSGRGTETPTERPTVGL
ncbi:transcriptional regulator, CdaR family [Nocardioides szechwanensis]|uniref:Transcriptional regulator, CdaR family n=1 Tax=Nocardioides szechwanensis TaxID=1005944 RepID=A0A1H0HFV5_9ACTN|nr:helix-turn-helix domain-containing protein [Nocardioides szechwanensis]SDO18099.1 transcriptional regulator, CdaR family [Nocardioides szechwanensis]